MQLYDTLSKTENNIKTDGGDAVRLYTCGPTVYNHAHIGNFRSYLFADMIVRSLHSAGGTVDWVMNITDVDDKTIRDCLKTYGPKATTADLRSYTDTFTNVFLAELRQLNIDPDRIRIIRVSEVIAQIQQFVLDLVDKGYAYKSEDGVFFSIEKYQQDFGDYGLLVGADFLAGKRVGARVRVDEYEKDDLSDFALWKAHTPEDGNIFWEHPVLGPGRPGWHVECSAINKLAFGDTPTDIHTGGVDLIFPHHTNEIAQSQPFYQPFAKLWAHCEHLQVDGRKMAKRDGSFYTLQDLKQRNARYPAAFRYLCLQTDFRKPMNFTWESLAAASTALEKLSQKFVAVHTMSSKTADTYVKSMTTDLLANLNTAGALAAVWEAVKDTTLSPAGLQAVLQFAAGCLGLDLSQLENDSDIALPAGVADILKKRQAARLAKDFALSDKLRDKLLGLGYVVKDTPEGQKLERKI